MRLRRCASALVLMFGAYLSLCQSAAALVANEQSVLNNLYNQTSGTNWYTATNWANGGDPCAAPPNGWYGIACDATGAHVTQIALPNNNLAGTLPSLNGLASLTSIDVSFNELSGSVPALAGLTSLRSFALNNNSLSGSIPALSNLVSLASFDVSVNRLTGPVPSLAGLKGLTHFVVFNNALTGSIPVLTGLTNLQTFNVNTNQLTGSIPSLSSLAQLVYVDVSNNGLSGSIPALTGLSGLTTFFSYNNQLTGSVPPLDNLTALAYFDVSHNQLSSMPALIGLPNLGYVDVGNNQLTGTLPSLSALTALNAFFALNNQLSGAFPALPKFVGRYPLFDISFNQLTGTIPDISTTTLSIFNVNNNALSGAAPAAPDSILLDHSALCPNFLTPAATPASANDANWNLATSATPWSQNCVSPRATTTTLSASPASAQQGQMVTLLAEVQASGAAPTGTIDFLDGNSVLCSRTLSSSGATCTTPDIPAGKRTIVAIYRGDGASQTSQSSVAVTVIAATTTTITASANPAAQGAQVVFTATVVGNGPTGSVAFSDNGTARGNVPLQNGAATLATSTLSAGNHTISVTYPGDGLNASSSAVLQETLIAPTMTTLISSANPAVQGAQVAFTATVSGNGPTGSIAFSDNGSALGSTPLQNGAATLATSTLGVGNHTINAIYSGDKLNASSSGTLQETVQSGASASATVLTLSANSIVAGQTLTLVAAVSGKAPSGNIEFRDGTTRLGTVALSSGSATFTASALAPGSHGLVAAYQGDANNLPSASVPVQVTVAKSRQSPPQTVTTLTVSPNLAAAGQPVTLTANVSWQQGPSHGGSASRFDVGHAVAASSAAAPSGTVAFLETGSNALLATISLDANGSAKWTTSSLMPGNHSITASYTGGNGESASSATVVITVGPAANTAVVPAPILSSWLLGVLVLVFAGMGEWVRRRALRAASMKRCYGGAKAARVRGM